MKVMLLICIVAICQSCTFNDHHFDVKPPPSIDETEMDFKTYASYVGSDFWTNASPENDKELTEINREALSKEDYFDIIDVVLMTFVFIGVCHLLNSNSDNAFNPHDSSGGHSYHLLYDAMFCFSSRHEVIE